MKIFKIGAAAFLQFLAITGFSAGNDSIIQNGGFENTLLNWKVEQAFDGAVETLDYDFYDGKHVLRISSKPTAKNSSSVSQELKLSPDTNYILKGFVKTTTLDDGKGAYVKIQRNDGTVIAQSGPFSTGDVWTEFLIPFNSGKKSDAKIQIALGGVDGNALFDVLGIDMVSTRNAEVNAKSKNIALNCPYVFSKEPNYAACKDAGDMKQLTDGAYTKGHFWIQKSTVGWTFQRFPVTITIDLGKDMPISGVSLNAAGGIAGVTFPKNIFVFLSTDGKNFYFAGDLVKKSKNAPCPEDIGYKTFTYNTTDFKTHGRYVRIFVNIAPGRYFFTDEIEVYEGAQEYLAKAYEGSPTLENAIPVKTLVEESIKERLQFDINTLTKRLNESQIPVEIKKSVSGNLKSLAVEVSSFSLKERPEDFKAIVPYNDLHCRVFSEYARMLEAEGIAPIMVWHKYRYAPMSLFETPQGANPSLNVKMMGNEYRAEVLNITNSSQKPISIALQIEGLPQCFELKQMEYTDTKEIKITSTALPEMSRVNDSYATNIPSGMTRQIWISFNSANVKAGSYAGKVILKSEGFEKSVPLNLSVSGIRLPEKASLDIGVWDYAVNFKMGINKQNQAAVIEDLKKHFVNVAYSDATQAALPKPDGVDSKGHLTKKLDFSPFDKWLVLWKDARHYQMFLLVNPDTKFAGFKRGTEEFKNAIKEWGTAWDEHIKSLGFEKGKVQIHFLDEPVNPEKYQTLKDWAEAFKAGNSMIEVFNDPLDLEKNGNLKYADEAFKYIDILCPLLSQYVKCNDRVRQCFDDRKKAGTKFYFYQCQGPNRTYDPGYFRTQPWYCFLNGMEGSMFWNYSDSTSPATPWNDYFSPTRESFALVYLENKVPVTTKHWEAFREGIEDYEYLRILKEKLKTTPQSVLKNIICPTGGNSGSPDMAIAEDVVERTGFFKNAKYDFEWKPDGVLRHADNGRLIALEIIEKLEGNNK